MQIEISKARQIQHPLWNNPSVSDNENDLWRNSLQLCPKFSIVLDFFRLDHRQTRRKRCRFHWRRDENHAAPAGAIRLRDYEWDLVVRSQHGLQRRNSEGWCAAKNDFHVANPDSARWGGKARIPGRPAPTIRRPSASCGSFSKSGRASMRLPGERTEFRRGDRSHAETPEPATLHLPSRTIRLSHSVRVPEP